MFSLGVATGAIWRALYEGVKPNHNAGGSDQLPHPKLSVKIAAFLSHFAASDDASVPGTLVSTFSARFGEGTILEI